MSSTQSAQSIQITYPVICIPRAMLFHTAEIVENAFNQAMGGKFVKSVGQSTTTDKAGIQFNVFFIHPDQDFKATRSTDTLYKGLKDQGTVNISTGSGHYFWKVKLYVPHLRAQHMPQPAQPVVAPVQVGPRIMTESDLAEFREYQREKAAAKAAEEKAKADKAAKEAEINRLGNLLYPLVGSFLSKEYPNFKKQGNITGMLLEMSHDEIQQLIDTPTFLETRVREAVQVLRDHYLAEAGVA